MAQVAAETMAAVLGNPVQISVQSSAISGQYQCD
jgi:hypothetical protein